MTQLQIINHAGQRVLTTAQLDDSFEKDAQTFTVNINRNKDRYVKGKHYILLEGESLSEFKVTTLQNDISSQRINKLYLWTDKCACRNDMINDCYCHLPLFGQCYHPPSQEAIFGT